MLSKPNRGGRPRPSVNIYRSRVECLFPKILDYRTFRSRYGRSEKTLFPGYLLVKLALFQHYYKIRWMKGVARFVGWGDGPAPIAEEVVEVIRRRMDGQGKVRIGQDFKFGERVRIRSGPLKDLIGVFERKISTRGRVRVLLHLVGYQASIQLHEALLERVA